MFLWRVKVVVLTTLDGGARGALAATIEYSRSLHGLLHGRLNWPPALRI